ncbi:fec3e051-039a-4079-a834-5caa60890a0e [Sclerotinia trifoliorum]|uniref:Fec3e051-039a-4079-a834-5caa60890a0e n=1 Tax=Sclerotinia trifoliorum TaxID=28548 RepID=A0A8H2W451_9HELO|nr:fec3e051-039a-4079-a834-5caa60890a0e [Sclerotinia trifoliorum]
MSLSPPGTAHTLGSNGIRRYRRTTACTTCRGRRVKCSRERPSCKQCRKGGRSCKYLNSEIPEFEFIEVNVPRISAAKTPSPDVLNPIVKRKFEIKLQATNLPVRGVAQIPSSHSLQKTPINYIDTTFDRPIRNIALTLREWGDDFISYFRTQLPAREVCDHFLDIFLEIQSTVPICHIDTLRDDYANLWTDTPPDTPVESALLMLAVLHCGAANSTINISQSSTLHDLYEQLLDIVALPTYQIHRRSSAIKLLQAYLLVNTFRARTLSSPFAYGFLSPAIRIAHSLYLHSEKPYHTFEVQNEVEKRIWWHLLFLDLQSTIATGARSLIPRNGYTTSISLPIDKIVGHAPNQSPTLPMIIAFQGQCQWVHHMRNWIRDMPNQEDLILFVKTMENLRDILPEGNVENVGPRAYLNLLIDETYCLLGLNFCEARQLEDTRWRHNIVRAACSFLQNYLYLSNASCEAKFGWVIPGLIQPHHALFILLMYLSSCASSDADAKLSKSLLDKIFNTQLSTHGFVAGHASSEPSKFAHSSSASPISHGSYGCPRQDVLVLLYRKIQAKSSTITSITTSSRLSSPSIAVLPQPGNLVPRGLNNNVMSVENPANKSEGAKWMELVTGKDVEDCAMDRELDDIMRGGEDVWDKWERLIETVFKC